MKRGETQGQGLIEGLGGPPSKAQLEVGGSVHSVPPTSAV